MRVVANGSVNINAELQRLRGSGVPSVQSHRADSSSQALRGELLEVGQWYGTRMIVFISPGYEVFFTEGNKLFAQSERNMALDRMYSEINHRIEFARWMQTAYRTGFEFALSFTAAGRGFNTGINIAFALAFYSNNHVRINRAIPLMLAFLGAIYTFFENHPRIGVILLRGSVRGSYHAKVRELQQLIGMLEGSGADRKRIEALVKLIINMVKLETAVRDRRLAEGLDDTLKSVLVLAKGELIKRLKNIVSALAGNISSCLAQLRIFKHNVSLDLALRNNIERVEELMSHNGMIEEARRIIASNSHENSTTNPALRRMIVLIRQIAVRAMASPKAVLEYANMFSELKDKLSTFTPTSPEDTLVFTSNDYHCIASDLIESVGNGANSLNEFMRQANHLIPQLQALSRDFNALKRSYNWGTESA